MNTYELWSIVATQNQHDFEVDHVFWTILHYNSMFAFNFGGEGGFVKQIYKYNICDLSEKLYYCD